MIDLTSINAAMQAAYQAALVNPAPQPLTPVGGDPDQQIRVVLYQSTAGSGFRVLGFLKLGNFTAVRVLNHGPDIASEREWPSHLEAVAACHNLAHAERAGIPLPFGDGSITLAAKEKDRSLFAQALILFREAESLQPDDAAKEAFRNSIVTLADHAGNTHSLTVAQARQLLVAYGSAYQALWNAAKQSVD